ncbi:hypothetical protein [Streptomyces sp. NEAU-L66]|uniref:hypothetical protein n=1 Tax=Streptomyces sp. NEAU-L66 TaxID=3390812 RepID=UPI0039C63B5F
MLTACAPPAAAGPGPGLLALLGAWTWLGVDPADTDLAHLFLAHVDAYLDAGLTSGRLLFGLVHPI